ncbi:TIGR00341 family protein [Gordonia sp. PKS22-38]|uniref:TIGR00341 family protein n=1 Tax=Gordonia prachuapensis TaxID=3115651 RepID=A0ABU7MVJ7_9ACTN|nr:TIGR00341 family protein [Gordonia sp. PKS22-38]
MVWHEQKGAAAVLNLIPDSQRRTLDELRERLDFDAGERSSKRSAFWIMLTLSGIIAVSGVLADSTATVIGAMIVAPLSTPILGIGLGIVTARARLVLSSFTYVLSGLVLVTFFGWLFAQLMPDPISVLSNSQVLGRTSPTLVDLFAAIATGFAGAIAITRRDVGDVLPGVAIAISLVPPLGVVGVCLGTGSPSLALGAFVLFASNVIAMIITSIVVFTTAGYGREAVTEATHEGQAAPRRGRVYVILTAALIVVAVPMIINSLSSLWSSQIAAAADSWLTDAGDTGGEVTDVSWSGSTVTVSVLAPQELPPIDDLQTTVDDLVPWDPEVVVVHTVGGRQGGD